MFHDVMFYIIGLYTQQGMVWMLTLKITYQKSKVINGVKNMLPFVWGKIMYKLTSLQKMLDEIPCGTAG